MSLIISALSAAGPYADDIDMHPSPMAETSSVPSARFFMALSCTTSKRSHYESEAPGWSLHNGDPAGHRLVSLPRLHVGDVVRAVRVVHGHFDRRAVGRQLRHLRAAQLVVHPHRRHLARNFLVVEVDGVLRRIAR